MELTEFRTSTERLRLSHSHRPRIFNGEDEREDEEGHLRGELPQDDSAAVNMMESHYRHVHPTLATHSDSSSYRRIPRVNNMQNYNVTVGVSMGHLHLHPWGRTRSFTRSISSLSNSSYGSDSDTGAVQTVTMKSSAKSSPVGSDYSMSNYDFNQTDSGACSAASPIPSRERETHDPMRGFNYSATPTAKELRMVFSWVDETDDGLICRADLRGFMNRVLNFEISESEAENLLLVYSNGRTLRTDTSLGGRRTDGGGAVVDFEGFLALYHCLCGEQASPEEQSLMAAASQVFDKTQLRSGRWG